LDQFFTDKAVKRRQTHNTARPNEKKTIRNGSWRRGCSCFDISFAVNDDDTADTENNKL
jgi:hypothetical protein